MTASDLTPNSTFPWIWTATKPVANSSCSGCPVASVAGHASCVAWRPDKAHLPTNDQRLNLPQLRRVQYKVWRRDRDAVGLYGSESTFRYNAAGSYNYSDAVNGTIVSASGTTLVLDLGIDPRNVTLYQGRQIEPEVGAYWITGYGGFGVIQPGDVVKYGTESVLSGKSEPTVKDVLGISGTEITLEVDQDCSNAMTPADPVYVGSFSAGVWNQAGNPEDWLFVEDPSYFRGRSLTKYVDPADLPADGIYALSSKGVAHPPGFTGDAFGIEGYTGGAWVTIGDAADRLFIRTLGAGSYDAVVSFGSAKPAYAVEPDALLSDIRAAYDLFRISYWEEARNASCETPCYTRCKHAKPAYSVTIGNCGAPDGTGTDGDGLGWYCEKRKFPVFVLSDEYDKFSDFPNIIPGQDGFMDTVTLEWHTASGVANFPSDGQCRQYGTCDQFTAAENDQGNDAPFRYEYHAGKVFRDIWGACNTKLVQFFPGVSESWNFQVQRIMHASIQWLAGMSLTSRTGYHPLIQFIYSGRWATSLETYTDDDGNEHLRKRWQHNWDAFGDPVALDDGEIPAGVAGFSTARDPLDASATVSGKEIERLGVRNVRDDGAITGRGLHAWPKALPAGQWIIPRCDTTLTGEVQER